MRIVRGAEKLKLMTVKNSTILFLIFSSVLFEVALNLLDTFYKPQAATGKEEPLPQRSFFENSIGTLSFCSQSPSIFAYIGFLVKVVRHRGENPFPRFMHSLLFGCAFISLPIYSGHFL